MNPVSLFAKEMTPLRKLLSLKAMTGGVSYTEQTKTGNPVSFEANVSKKLKGLSIPFTDENGLTELTVYHCGKNLFDEVYTDIKTTTVCVYKQIYVGSESVTMSTTTPKGSGGGANLFLLPGSVSSGGSTSHDGVSAGISRTVAPVDGFITIAYRAYSGSDPRDEKTMLEYGETVTEYEPYSGMEYPVTWEDSATAGTFEATTGVLTITAPESKTVQLDPVQISTLVGVNNLWTDTGGTNTVKYLQKT